MRSQDLSCKARQTCGSRGQSSTGNIFASFESCMASFHHTRSEKMHSKSACTFCHLSLSQAESSPRQKLPLILYPNHRATRPSVRPLVGLHLALRVDPRPQNNLSSCLDLCVRLPPCLACQKTRRRSRRFINVWSSTYHVEITFKPYDHSPSQRLIVQV